MEPAKGGEHDATVVTRASVDVWKWAGVDPFGNLIELVEVAPS